MFSAYRMNTIKNTFLSCIIIFSVVTLGLAQQESIAVFVSGNEGHKSYRIPAIIDLPNGDLLAFAEGRVHGSGDYGDVNIVLKRSRLRCAASRQSRSGCRSYRSSIS
jgi:hypothetical protein